MSDHTLERGLLLSEIAKLKGHTLQTLALGRKFEVVDVSSDAVKILIEKSQKIRTIDFDDEIAPAYFALISNRELTRSNIQANYSPRNPAYVAAILSKLPNVSQIPGPICLIYTQHK